MVDMAVGQPDLFNGDAGLLDRFLNLRHVAAGVDHHGLLGGFAPDDGAVLLEQRHRHDDGAGLGLGLGFSLIFSAIFLGHGRTLPIFSGAPSKRFGTFPSGTTERLAPGRITTFAGWARSEPAQRDTSRSHCFRGLAGNPPQNWPAGTSRRSWTATP